MKNNFNQLCVWPATLLGDSTETDFVNFFAEQGYRVKFAEEIATHTKNKRHDILFYIHDEDIPKFCIARINMGIKWWEDYVANKQATGYTKETMKKYPTKW